MDKRLNFKHEQLLAALLALQESIMLFDDLVLKKPELIGQYRYDQLYKAFRESMIQRFEFCTELFWKYLKIYVEGVAGLVEYNSPTPVIRAAFKVGVLTENDAEQFLEMVQDRNRTSHIYKEEIAEELLKKIPAHYQSMNLVAHQLKPREVM